MIGIRSMVDGVGKLTYKFQGCRRPEGKRPYFAAGDSDTDIEFMRDATYPMFILPKAALATPYACATSACKDENGVSTPCRDLGGNIIPPQADTVHS